MSNLWLDIFTSGIDFDLPGNGGPECLAHSSVSSRAIESIFAIITCTTTLIAGLKGHVRPSITNRANDIWNSGQGGILRMWLLYSMLITWVAEAGYKLITRQFIFVVNPCHLLCLVHIYLLSSFHNQYLIFKTYVFRIHLFFLHGPIMAFIFPVTNTLFLPGEVVTYWIEHVLLLTIPIYLLSHYSVPIKSFRELVNWSLIAYGVWGLYHYIFLQPLALLTLGNLNSVLCPAITDPFRGPYYRLHGLWHQLIATAVSGGLWCSFGKSLIIDQEDQTSHNYEQTNDSGCKQKKISE